jgi:hypothetical protein
VYSVFRTSTITHVHLTKFEWSDFFPYEFQGTMFRCMFLFGVIMATFI